MEIARTSLGERTTLDVLGLGLVRPGMVRESVAGRPAATLVGEVDLFLASEHEGELDRFLVSIFAAPPLLAGCFQVKRT